MLNTGDKSKLPAELNDHLHKKRLMKIGHPAIIWHRAYFQPEGCDGHKEIEWQEQILKVFKDTIEKTTQALQEKPSNDKDGKPVKAWIKKVKILPDEDDLRGETKLNSGQSVFRKFEFGLAGQRVRLTIAFEVYEEFWSKKLILDFSEFDETTLDDENTLPKMQSAIKNLGRLFSYITRDMNQRYQRDLRSPGSSAHSQVISPEDMKSISRDISRNLHEVYQVLFPPDEGRRDVEENPNQGIEDTKPFCIHKVQLRFADFIGHSLGLRLDPAGGPSPYADIQEAKRAFPITRPDDPIARISSDVTYEQGTLDSVIRATLPIIRDINPILSDAEEPSWDKAKPTTNDGEFCLTLINRKRALYASSLGRAGVRLPFDKDNKFTQPLGYLIVCPHQAEWQIGRIIDTLHNIGMYRLASMHRFEGIAKAQEDLRKLQADATKSSFKDGISRVSKDLTRIVSSIEDKNDGSGVTPISGNLRYRLDWAASYSRSYWKLVDLLEFERVEGYQHYKEFVQRNLNDNFENIKIVRKRLEYIDEFLIKRSYISNQQSTEKHAKSTSTVTNIVAFLTLLTIYPTTFAISENINPSLRSLVKWLGCAPLPLTEGFGAFLLATILFLFFILVFVHFELLSLPPRRRTKQASEDEANEQPIAQTSLPRSV